MLRLWVRIPRGWGGMEVCLCVECCVLSGRGLCDGLITRPEESYWLWCVVVCDLETSRLRRPWSALGRSATGKRSESNRRLFLYFLYLLSCFLTWICLIGWHSVKRLRNSCRTITVANSRDGSDVSDNRFQYMQERHDTQHTTWYELRLRHIHALWDFTTR
jgi:hypothetical protein